MDQYQLIARWLNGSYIGKLSPWQIDIDTTNICNQACYYCNSELFREHKPTFQSVESYRKLIDEFASWRSVDPTLFGSISNIIFSGGGEPTLLPDYETLIEQSIDYGYSVAINTNGTKLHKILSLPENKIQKMAYIGLDIDSADPITYEKIRRSKFPSPFEDIKNTAIELGKINAPLDLKVLLLPQNSTAEEIEKIFNLAKQVNARLIHFRPAVLEGYIHHITHTDEWNIKEISKKYNIKYNLALGRLDKRTYNHCHQMFLFPSFCADGNIYVCCEQKGNKDLCLGSWVNDDWRDLWCSEKHKEIYRNFKLTNCLPCRPNRVNNSIEEAIVNTTSILRGFI